MPTRNRAATLRRSIEAVASLAGHHADARDAARVEAEVIVIDNASDEPVRLPQHVGTLPVRVIRLDTNEGAASRNVGVREAEYDWIVMLDDDSYPVDTGFAHRLRTVPDGVAAVSADIWLPGLGERERGGLPEVFVGCGVAIRRADFLGAGGYDKGFEYYVEEYDLAARFLMAGKRVEFDPWFRVEHHKVTHNRDMNRILRLLTRNNGWVASRYAPRDAMPVEMREIRARYRAIACKERALAGYAQGLVELKHTRRAQARSPMDTPTWERFTGLSYARAAIGAAHARSGFRRACVAEPGKNELVVRRVLAELGVAIAARLDDADAIVIGTMSPGPMLDAHERLTQDASLRGIPVVAPWERVERGYEKTPLVPPCVASRAG